MSHTVIKDGKNYDSWGTFDCSVCSKSVFIQYDSNEKPSTGRLLTHKGKCYCLCDKCVNKCVVKGKAVVLKGAHPYEPTESSDNDVPEEWKELESNMPLASILPAVAMWGIALAIIKMSKKERKKLFKELNKKKKEEKSGDV